jgi:hypothetical protein
VSAGALEAVGVLVADLGKSRRKGTVWRFNTVALQEAKSGQKWETVTFATDAECVDFFGILKELRNECDLLKQRVAAPRRPAHELSAEETRARTESKQEIERAEFAAADFWLSRASRPADSTCAMQAPSTAVEAPLHDRFLIVPHGNRGGLEFGEKMDMCTDDGRYDVKVAPAVWSACLDADLELEQQWRASGAPAVTECDDLVRQYGRTLGLRKMGATQAKVAGGVARAKKASSGGARVDADDRRCLALVAAGADIYATALEAPRIALLGVAVPRAQSDVSSTARAPALFNRRSLALLYADWRAHNRRVLAPAGVHSSDSSKDGAAAERRWRRCEPARASERKVDGVPLAREAAEMFQVRSSFLFSPHYSFVCSSILLFQFISGALSSSHARGGGGVAAGAERKRKREGGDEEGRGALARGAARVRRQRPRLAPLLPSEATEGGARAARARYAERCRAQKSDAMRTLIAIDGETAIRFDAEGHAVPTESFASKARDTIVAFPSRREHEEEYMVGPQPQPPLVGCNPDPNAEVVWHRCDLCEEWRGVLVKSAAEPWECSMVPFASYTCNTTKAEAEAAYNKAKAAAATQHAAYTRDLKKWKARQAKSARRAKLKTESTAVAAAAAAVVKSPLPAEVKVENRTGVNRVTWTVEPRAAAGDAAASAGATVLGRAFSRIGDSAAVDSSFLRLPTGMRSPSRSRSASLIVSRSNSPGQAGARISSGAIPAVDGVAVSRALSRLSGGAAAARGTSCATCAADCADVFVNARALDGTLTCVACSLDERWRATPPAAPSSQKSARSSLRLHFRVTMEVLRCVYALDFERAASSTAVPGSTGTAAGADATAEPGRLATFRNEHLKSLLEVRYTFLVLSLRFSFSPPTD